MEGLFCVVVYGGAFAAVLVGREHARKRAIPRVCAGGSRVQERPGCLVAAVAIPNTKRADLGWCVCVSRAAVDDAKSFLSHHWNDQHVIEHATANHGCVSVQGE